MESHRVAGALKGGQCLPGHGASRSGSSTADLQLSGTRVIRSASFHDVRRSQRRGACALAFGTLCSFQGAGAPGPSSSAALARVGFRTLGTPSPWGLRRRLVGRQARDSAGDRAGSHCGLSDVTCGSSECQPDVSWSPIPSTPTAELYRATADRCNDSRCPCGQYGCLAPDP
jgi:hypothetical protein